MLEIVSLPEAASRARIELTDALSLWYRHCAQAFAEKGTPEIYFRRHFEEDPHADVRAIFVAVERSELPNLSIAATLRLFIRKVFSRNRIINFGGVGEVCTLPKFRRQGLAKALLTRVIEFAAERRIELLGLHTGNAAPLYYQVGFRAVERRFVSVQESALCAFDGMLTVLLNTIDFSVLEKVDSGSTAGESTLVDDKLGMWFATLDSLRQDTLSRAVNLHKQGSAPLLLDLSNTEHVDSFVRLQERCAHAGPFEGTIIRTTEYTRCWVVPELLHSQATSCAVSCSGSSSLDLFASLSVCLAKRQPGDIRIVDFSVDFLGTVPTNRPRLDDIDWFEQAVSLFKLGVACMASKQASSEIIDAESEPSVLTFPEPLFRLAVGAIQHAFEGERVCSLIERLLRSVQILVDTSRSHSDDGSMYAVPANSSARLVDCQPDVSSHVFWDVDGY